MHVLQIHSGYLTAKKFFNEANSSTYDLVVKYTTFGNDNLWKNKILKFVRGKKSILELACGTGVMTEKINSDHFVVGLDLTLDYLLIAKQKFAINDIIGSQKISMINATAEIMPFKKNSFDAVISSYLVKYTDIATLVDECWRVLQKGGIAVFHDFVYPANRTIRLLWSFYFLLLRAAGNILKPWSTVFRDLSDVVKNSDWVVQLLKALKERGFETIALHYQTLGTSAIVSAIKP